MWKWPLEIDCVQSQKARKHFVKLLLLLWSNSNIFCLIDGEMRGNTICAIWSVNQQTSFLVGFTHCRSMSIKKNKGYTFYVDIILQRFKVGLLKSVTISHFREHNGKKCRWFTAFSLCKTSARTFWKLYGFMVITACMIIFTIPFVLATEDMAANVNHTVFSIMFSVVPSMTLCTLRLCFDSDSSAFCF